MFMNYVLLHFHLQLVILYTSSDLWLNSLCFFNLLIFRVISGTCSRKKRSRQSADILQEVRAAQVSQRPWPLPRIPYRHGGGQIVLHKLLPDAADPLRRHKFICTTYDSRRALCLKSVKSTSTHSQCCAALGGRSTRHTGGGPTSSGMSRNGLRPLPDKRTPSQKACHPQSQPARASGTNAFAGVPASAHRVEKM